MAVDSDANVQRLHVPGKAEVDADSSELPRRVRVRSPRFLEWPVAAWTGKLRMELRILFPRLPDSAASAQNCSDAGEKQAEDLTICGVGVVETIV